MSDAEKPMDTPPAGSGSLLPLATAAAAIAAALIALASFVLLISVALDVSSLQSRVRKLSHAVEALEEKVEKIGATTPPSIPKAERPAPAPPRPSHIDASDAATDCVVRPGSKNPLADCLK